MGENNGSCGSEYSSTGSSSFIENYPCLPNHQRINENTKESQILVWVWNLLQEVAYFWDYDQYLQNGVIVCRLMNAIKPGSILGEVTPGDNLKHKRKNIERFLEACSVYGVSAENMFEVEDLLFLQNLPQVTLCLFSLGDKARADPNFDGPHLGQVLYEPIDTRTKRRAGLPEGDDLHIAHVDIKMLKRMMSIDSL